MVAERFDPLVVTAYPLVAIAPVPFSLLCVCLGAFSSWGRSYGAS